MSNNFKLDTSKDANIGSILGIVTVILIRILGGGLIIGAIVGFIVYGLYSLYKKSKTANKETE